MAIRTPLWLQAGTYSAELDRLMMLMFMYPAGASGTFVSQTGVLPGQGNGMLVTQTSTASMQLQVASGLALINGTQSSTQGAYALINDAITNVTVTAANSTNPRIDLVVLEVLDATYSGGSNVGQLRVVAGTPASSPVAPATPANSLILARVAVAANATSITTANLTDVRNYTAVRGEPLNTASTARPVSPIQSQQIFESNTFRLNEWDSVAARWVKIGGPIETIVENGNLGSSGVFGTGSEVNLINTGYTLPFSSNLTQVHFNTAWNSAGNSILNVRLSLQGATTEDYTQTINFAGTGIPLNFNVPKTMYTGTNLQVLLWAQVASGANVQLTTSAIRISG